MNTSLPFQLNINKLFFFFTLLFPFQSFPQPDTLWTKTFGGSNIDVALDVQLTSDGGYILTGYTRSFGTMSGRNIWLIKTDADGNEQWNKAFGGNSDEEAYSVQQTATGGYILTGYTKSFGAGLNDVFLLKTDSLGNQIWMKTFGGSNDDEGYSVKETSDGGYIIGGVTSSFAAGGRDVWMIKTDSAGIESWRRSHGGLSSDGAWSIQQTFDGGFILTGWTFSHGPSGLGNAWLLKTNSSGFEEWNKAFGGSSVDRGYSVKQTADSGYIITGYTDSFGAGNYDMLLIKTDKLGNEKWFKTFGGTGRDYGNSVEQTSDGGYISAGYTLSFGAGGDDVWLVKTDSSGNKEWDKTFGGGSSDVAYGVKETPDGGYIIAGHTLSYGAGIHDAWLIKLDAVIPVELISFNAFVSGSSVHLKWRTATELNNSGFEVERKAHRAEGMAWRKIAFVEGSGTTTELQQYSFTDNLDHELDLNLDQKIKYRLKQIDFDGSFEYSSEVEVEINNLPTKFALFQNYPNPFNPVTKIKYAVPFSLSSQERVGVRSFVELKVYDVLGNEVATLVNEVKEPGEYEVEFNGSALSSGVYYYRLTSGIFSDTKKFVLMK